MWGSFLGHKVFSFDSVAEFVQSLVYGSPGFTDVHENFLGNFRGNFLLRPISGVLNFPHDFQSTHSFQHLSELKKSASLF